MIFLHTLSEILDDPGTHSWHKGRHQGVKLATLVARGGVFDFGDFWCLQSPVFKGGLFGQLKLKTRYP